MPQAQPVTLSSDPGRSRLLLLDCLRLTAALAVVSYHYTSAFGDLFWGLPSRDVFPRLSGITAYGALGVQLFFMISGFVILMSAYGKSVGQFAASRISRLFPAYWAAVVLAAVLLLVITDGVLNKVTWTDALVNLTMAQQSIGVKSLDGVFWTLWVELLFYVTIAFFLWRGMTYQRLLAFIALWPLLGMLSIQAGSDLLRTLLIADYSPLFAVGMGLYLIHVKGHNLILWMVVGVNVMLSCHQTAVRFLPGMSLSTGRELSPEVVWLIILGFAAIVAAITTTPLRHVGWKWMGIAGALTYPVYLVHEMWGWWVIRNLHEQLGPWLTILIATSFVLALAWAIHRFIERPFAPSLRGALLRSMSRELRATGKRVAVTSVQHEAAELVTR